MNPNGRYINIVLFFNEFHYMSYCLHQFIKTLASKPFGSSKKHSTPFGVLCFFVLDLIEWLFFDVANICDDFISD